MKAESCEKIWREQKQKMRRIADEDYTIGRQVFYKQQNLKRWQDHPTTDGFDSKVLVRYG